MSSFLLFICILGSGVGYCADKMPKRQESKLQFLVVRGFIDKENHIVVYPLYFTEEKRLGAPDGRGPYAAELQEGTGRTLATYPFGTGLLNVTMEDKPEIQIDSHSFAFEIPWGDSVQKIVIRQGTKTLWSSTRSRNSPTVSFVRPHEGESVQGQVVVEWTGFDQDRDTLYYLVEYSKDGGLTWEPLSGFLSETRLVVDTTRLAASKQGVLGIVCTDGFNTTKSTVRIDLKNPLAIEYTNPGEGETDVSFITIIYIKFRSDIKADTLNKKTFKVLDKESQEIPGRMSYDRKTHTAVFVPRDTLRPLTKYTTRVVADIEDTAGNKLGTDYEWTFTTGPGPN
jgi:hypothetical protein